MKSKKIVIIFGLLFVLLITGGYFIIQNMRQNQDKVNNQEYTPQEEISEEQSRQTIVSLYFKSKENQELIPEARLVYIKEMINNPCDKLINLLLDGPKSDKQERVIPENTKLLKTEIQGDCITIDFSSEFLNYDKTNSKNKENMINSIVNTVTQLTEINNVKILIDGNVNSDFNEVYSKKIT